MESRASYICKKVKEIMTLLPSEIMYMCQKVKKMNGWLST